MFLPHFPVAAGAGGGEFQNIITHGKVYIVDHTHEHAAPVLCRFCKQAALYGTSGTIPLNITPAFL
jgi:hypothetical protein